MAAVYLGRLSGIAGFEKLVAVKVIHPHLVEQREFVEMFLDEARLSAKIHHPNVVEIFDIVEDNGLYFIVAELVQGRSLRDFLKGLSRAGERLNSRAFLSIIANVCDALHAAHMLTNPDGSPMRLVHRDVTPSNILISYEGFVKLVDFGIAFAEGRVTRTRTGVIKGKLGYMAPEQLRGKPADRRVDIFSLGVILYLLSTGKHPFPGPGYDERVHRIFYESPPKVRSIVPEMEPALEKTIEKALAKDPDQRHQTAEELGMELRQVLALQGGPVSSGDLSRLMNRLFAKEISEEKNTLALVAEMDTGRDRDTSQQLDKTKNRTGIESSAETNQQRGSQQAVEQVAAILSTPPKSIPPAAPRPSNAPAAPQKSSVPPASQNLKVPVTPLNAHVPDEPLTFNIPVESLPFDVPDFSAELVEKRRSLGDFLNLKVAILSALLLIVLFLAAIYFRDISEDNEQANSPSVSFQQENTAIHEAAPSTQEHQKGSTEEQDRKIQSTSNALEIEEMRNPQVTRQRGEMKWQKRRRSRPKPSAIEKNDLDSEEGESPDTVNTGSELDKSVEVLLRGIPPLATVQLDGNDAPVVGGKITVPADGKHRELKVFADGYRPYIQYIAPDEDRELLVKLQKNRDLPKKPSHTIKKRQEKTDGKKLLGSPY